MLLIVSRRPYCQDSRTAVESFRQTPAPQEPGDDVSESISAPEAQPVAPPTSPLSAHRTFRLRLQALGEILLCSDIPTQFAIGALLMVAGWQLLDRTGQLSLPFVLTMSLVDTLVLIVLMVLLTRARGDSVRDLWAGRRPLKKEAVLGLLLIPPIFLFVVLILNAVRLWLPGLHNVEINPLEALAAGGAANAAMFALVAIFAGGVREELQRAFLLRRFEQHLGGARVGVIVLSVAFGLGHYVQGWDAVITTGTLGAFWALIYLRRGSSTAAVVSHAGFNALEILRVAIWGT